MAARYCSNCGTPVGADDRFCPSCGHPAISDAPVSPQAPLYQPMAPSYGIPSPAAPLEDTSLFGRLGRVFNLIQRGDTWQTFLVGGVGLPLIGSLVALALGGSPVANPASALRLGGATILGGVISGLLIIWGTAALLWHAAAERSGSPTTLSEALRQGRRRFWPVFVTALLYGLMVIGGAILVIVPGIYLANRYVFANPIRTLFPSEEHPFRRAEALVDGCEGVFGVFWRWLVIGIVLSIAAAIIGAILGRVPAIGPLLVSAANFAEGAIMALYLMLMFVDWSAARGQPIGPPETL